ncbi:major facilitator superfamily transporter [Acetobacter nitrogenifigens DSM 23921 = NBRC 105050]|uniref:MFS transporter n=1 Tax=Acetobacter nitrogenifigens DSM 23921 = NBRC 105050 TaxID=1120919 RepID=A0A511XBS6_9PROT|nr:MFS transporter [Acetobacter nitrogenifigens]GBQ90452.1 major facilitator superfamily transporter [Acetobacter nitrogenifigens DSM 23921 = NBRC 105050]GEN60345.1 MFS transporter [Acetobacter nitrogenifigens DSM 23921 = NBRC 105050]
MTISPTAATEFQRRVLFAGASGLFTDGYMLGSISPALPGAIATLGLGPTGAGAVAAAPFLGLLLGSLFGGPVIDRYGRRLPFVWDMWLFLLFAIGHAFVHGAADLIILRFLTGLLLGVDYVAGKVYVSECVANERRGALMSWLSVSWIAGYTAAFVAGSALRDIFGADEWRLIFASASIPVLVAIAFRKNLPETAPWLAHHGRFEAALAVGKRCFGAHWTPSVASSSPTLRSSGWKALIRPPQHRVTFGVVAFYSLHNVPYLLLNTFLPGVLAGVGVRNPFTAGILYDALIMAGALFGLKLIDVMGRRTLAIGSLCIQAALLFGVIAFAASPQITLILLALFGAVLASADSLTYAYPPECFPTALRALGIGVTVAVSRALATVATFIFPKLVTGYGMQWVIGGLGVILAVGAAVCAATLQETRDAHIT